MKAIVCPAYGAAELLELREVERPTAKDNELLVRVRASAVTAADTMMRSGTPYIGRLATGLRRPARQIPGTGFAGEVEAVGKAVTGFRVGDRVFGETGLNFGANAEYLCVAEDALVATLPAGISFEQAAPVCDGALTSLSFLRHIGQLQRGQRLLVIGASGSLGTAAVQLGKHFGAEVTGLCSGANRELVMSLGADRVIDYTREDFTRADLRYDIIFDTVGKSSFARCKAVLSDDGQYLSPVLGLPLFRHMLQTALAGRKKARFSATGMRPAAELRLLVEQLKALLETGALKMVIDRRYPLAQVAEAHAYVEQGHKRGNLVINIDDVGD
ncbi:NAD(P)-dependent alcohol dehydrogenase [Marinobacterium arenosum]|uniref:NAD(P)-dependent alcohol dehydrogenase n=1 Tax=Marinobacterium arenosum TaxID=2862496 RepID=UPI001C97DCD3|nr:NAD(P)-dependent alcohol dehydrogenase [Marinobacterium arenosum]MBY4677414.1 NAD(P)-dependent alcohol dehydrogenase [Marinobacterium arenosum]